MDPAHVQRLKDEQKKAIDQTQEAINKLDKFRQDYETLKDRLETLPHKISHDVMVPFGKLAFMPGRLVHTNEITVLLGDDWFVECSAKQACEIVGRRIEAVDQQVADLNKQKGLLQPRQEFTEEFSALGGQEDNMREIVEEYDEEQEKQWKIEHRKKMREYREQERKERAQALAEESKPAMTDADMWARLDELERQEREGREMLKLDEGLEDRTSLITDDFSQHVERSPPVEEQKTARTLSEIEEEDSGTTDESTDEEEDLIVRPSTIRFSHTRTNNGHGVKFGENPSENASEPAIKSPADIYKMFSPDKPKSILKSSDSSTSRLDQVRHVTYGETTSQKITQPPKPKPTHIGPSAFTGAIVEREDTVPPVPPVAAGENSIQPKRISKFKAQRMKQRHPPQ